MFSYRSGNGKKVRFSRFSVRKVQPSWYVRTTVHCTSTSFLLLTGTKRAIVHVGPHHLGPWQQRASIDALLCLLLLSHRIAAACTMHTLRRTHAGVPPFGFRAGRKDGVASSRPAMLRAPATAGHDVTTHETPGAGRPPYPCMMHACARGCIRTCICMDAPLTTDGLDASCMHGSDRMVLRFGATRQPRRISLSGSAQRPPPATSHCVP